MPASRTRKKTKQKQAASARVAQSKAHLAKLAHQLNTDPTAPLPACTKCHGEREKVTQEQVPADTWEKMEPMREAMANEGFSSYDIAHCPTCNEYSLLSKWNTF